MHALVLVIADCDDCAKASDSPKDPEKAPIVRFVQTIENLLSVLEGTNRKARSDDRFKYEEPR